MKSLSSQFEGLANRQGFNASVRHIKTVINVVDRVASKENLADVVHELIEAKVLDKDEVLPVVSMVLGDKFLYKAVSVNLPSVITDISEIAVEAGTWNAMDLVAVYQHPDLGPILINPKNPKSLAHIDRLTKHALLVTWAGCFAQEGDPALLENAARYLADLFAGKKPKVKTAMTNGAFAYKAPKEKNEPVRGTAGTKKVKKATVSVPKAGKGQPVKVEVAPAPVEEHKPAVQAERALKPGSHMTPLYSVTVVNELFHNGNVEAWKRIIASYTAKFPGLQVLVYYDGERIIDINALFKWGKVKHGSTIQFAVSGDEIQGVAKLQRYLAQGASPQFEAFLRGPVNAVLQLF